MLLVVLKNTFFLYIFIFTFGKIINAREKIFPSSTKPPLIIWPKGPRRTTVSLLSDHQKYKNHLTMMTLPPAIKPHPPASSPSALKLNDAPLIMHFRVENKTHHDRTFWRFYTIPRKNQREIASTMSVKNGPEITDSTYFSSASFVKKLPKKKCVRTKAKSNSIKENHKGFLVETHREKEDNASRLFVQANSAVNDNNIANGSIPQVTPDYSAERRLFPFASNITSLHEHFLTTTNNIITAATIISSTTGSLKSDMASATSHAKNASYDIHQNSIAVLSGSLSSLNLSTINGDKKVSALAPTISSSNLDKEINLNLSHPFELAYEFEEAPFNFTNICSSFNIINHNESTETSNDEQTLYKAKSSSNETLTESELGLSPFEPVPVGLQSNSVLLNHTNHTILLPNNSSEVIPVVNSSIRMSNDDFYSPTEAISADDVTTISTSTASSVEEYLELKATVTKTSANDLSFAPSPPGIRPKMNNRLEYVSNIDKASNSSKRKPETSQYRGYNDALREAQKGRNMSFVGPNKSKASINQKHNEFNDHQARNRSFNHLRNNDAYKSIECQEPSTIPLTESSINIHLENTMEPYPFFPAAVKNSFKVMAHSFEANKSDDSTNVTGTPSNGILSSTRRGPNITTFISTEDRSSSTQQQWNIEQQPEEQSNNGMHSHNLSEVASNKTIPTTPTTISNSYEEAIVTPNKKYEKVQKFQDTNFNGFTGAFVAPVVLQASTYGPPLTQASSIHQENGVVTTTNHNQYWPLSNDPLHSSPPTSTTTAKEQLETSISRDSSKFSASKISIPTEAAQSLSSALITLKVVDLSGATQQPWQPWEMDCTKEVDERGEELCAEWAIGGLCEANRATQFLFCRKTCLCTGPPTATQKT